MKVRFETILAFIIGLLLALGIHFLMPSTTETNTVNTVIVYVENCPCNPCAEAEMDFGTDSYLDRSPDVELDVDDSDEIVSDDEKENPSNNDTDTDTETEPENPEESPSKHDNGNHYGNDKPDNNPKDVKNSHNGMNSRADFDAGKTKGKDK